MQFLVLPITANKIVVPEIDQKGSAVNRLKDKLQFSNNYPNNLFTLYVYFISLLLWFVEKWLWTSYGFLSSVLVFCLPLTSLCQFVHLYVCMHMRVRECQ